MIRAGELNRRVTLQVRTTTTDPQRRTAKPYYTDAGQVWSKFVPGHARNQQQYGETVFGVIKQFVFRPNSNVAPGNRIIDRVQTYEIVSVDEYPDRYEATVGQVEAQND